MEKDETMNDSISRTKMISLLEMRAEFAANDDIFDELINIIGKVKKMPPVDANNKTDWHGCRMDEE